MSGSVVRMRGDLSSHPTESGSAPASSSRATHSESFFSAARLRGV